MPHAFNDTGFTGVFPPRSIAFLRATVAAVAATLVTAILVLALAALLSLPGIRPGFAQSPREQSPGQIQGQAQDSPAGLFFQAGRDDAAFEAPLLKSDVHIAVNGAVARVRVRQHFLNPTKVWLEGIYVFPLPERSAVDRLTLVVGEKTIEGEILERAQARRAYDQAAAAGQHASLLSSERPNVFTTSIANIGPGQEIAVEIEYQDAALFDNGRYALRFPMVVAPRYTPPGSLEVAGTGKQGVVPAAGQGGEGRDILGPVRHPEDPTPNPVSLSVALDAGVPIESIESPYHAVEIEEPDPRRRLITLADGPVEADRDFVLEWRPALGGAPLASVFAEEIAGDSYILATVMPPAAQDSGPAAPPRDVVVIIDTSGSMHGPSLDQAKAAVLRALRRLRPADRFNVIRFASDTSSLFGEVREATPSNVRRGARFIRALEAEGGTEMTPALVKGLAKPAQDGRLRQVLFLTDGAVGNEAELFEIIAGLIGNARLFTVGIGSAPNSYFMRKAAEIGKGSFTHIGKVEEVAARMDRLLTKLARPALTDLAATWPGAVKGPEIYPAALPDLYAGEPVSFTARVPGQGLRSLAGTLEITGRRGNEAWSARLPLGSLRPAAGVAAIWARAKIERIEDGAYTGADRDNQRAEALEVALAHRLVTKYTSLVAIEPDPVRPEGMEAARREIPRNLPAGWDYAHVFGGAAQEMKLRALPAPLLKRAKLHTTSVSLPQTATPAALHALVAVALVCSGLYVLLLAGRLRRSHADG